MTRILYLAFVLSGAAGLIYESIWSRYLGLFVGHSAYAQIIVLTIFLGGMSAGALLAGERSARLRDPLLAYALVELAVGVFGLAFHPAFVRITEFAYDSIFPRMAGGAAAVTIVKWTLAAALILPQSVLLGMTFPLMSAAVLRIARAWPGRVLSLLYFANSIGGAVGVLVAGFWLLGAVGLDGTLTVAALINAAVFVAAYGVSRFAHVRGAPAAAPERRDLERPFVAPREETETVTTPDAPGHSGEPAMRHTRLPALLLVVAFGTAVASFIYEIAWIRMLSLVLGSATHSFELMLSAFVLGIALGAFWARRHADRFRHPVRALGWVQWSMGLAAMATIPVYLASFRWTAALLGALSDGAGAYTLFGIARYAFCLAVMLPATFFAGITLPLITRTLLVAGHGERAIGRVYGVNTLGSIVGVVLAGLVLLPAVGLRVLLVEGALLDMALGVLLLRTSAGHSLRALGRVTLATAGLALAAWATLALFRFDRAILSSGVYRYGVLPTPGDRQILFYRDGRTATVSVGRSTGRTSLFISTNGKPDASLDLARWLHPTPDHLHALEGDVSTQVMIPLVTLAYAPGARTAAVIGEGSGLTSHLLLGSPRLERLVTIEIEPEMIAGSRLFYPANRRVFDDPRARFAIDDAKSYCAPSRRRYDVIVSEPSNPWVSGVAGLFTDEFYARIRRYLAPRGVFGQWLHLYEINDGLVLSVLAALHRNFPSYDVYMTSSADILIIASLQPRMPRPDWSVFDEPLIARDLEGSVPFTPRSLDAARLLTRDELAPVLDHFLTPNSDYFPLLDLGAERARFLRSSANGFATLRSNRFDAIGALFGERVAFDTLPRTAVPGVPRMRALALGALLRRLRSGAPVGDTATGLAAGPAVQRMWSFDATLAGAPSPPDWHAWVTTALEAERDVHGGTAGVIDSAFYASLARYMNANHAPSGASEAIAFRRALAGWDFAGAARAADSLVPLAEHGTDWIGVDELRQGATVARLVLGDSTGARRIWRTLADRATRGDLRGLLISACLRELRCGSRVSRPGGETASRRRHGR